MRRAAALLLLAFLTGCSSGGGAATPGAEVTDVSSASEEPTGTESPESGGGQRAVSAELPGLPIGGNDVEFAGPSTECANVSWTGGAIPAGVSVEITHFAVPGQFAVDDQPCGDGPPCIGGQVVFTSNGGSCDVGVTWNGAPLLDGEFGSLAADAGRVTCPDAATCVRFALAAKAAASGSVIGLTVPSPSTTPSTESSTE